jgi:mono/diheme cytochrome c family protein
VKRFAPLPFAAVAFILGACSLAGDVTPPPGLENVQVAPAATQPPLTAPRHAPDLSAGKALFGERCGPCHGDSGLGDGPQASALPNPPAALANTALARAAIPDEWYDVVTRGRLDRFMPPFSSLSDDQRWSVVGYALSLGLAPDRLADGERIFGESCAGCHGEHGQGGETGPDLTRPEFQATRSEQSIFDSVTQGVDPGMPGSEASLTEDERWAVADFVRQLGLQAQPAGGSQPASPTAAETVPVSGETSPVAGEGTPTASASSTPALVGRITGTITNGTPGAAVPNDLIVTLHAFDGETEIMTESQPARSGVFAFDIAELTPGRLFVATAEYLGSQYASNAVHLTSDPPNATLPITIYETTNDSANVQVDRLHLLVSNPGGGVLQIVELWILSNSGDHTVLAPEGKGGLEGFLPEGATQVSFDEATPGERFQQTDTGFTDLRPLPPGTDSGEWVFSYVLPFGRQLDLSRSSAYPIGSIVVLVPEGMKVGGDQVVDAGSRDVQGQSLHTYSLGPIPPGVDFRLRLSGQPATSVGGLSSSPWILGMAVLGVALIGAGLFWFRPRRRGQAQPEAEADLDAMLVSLASLDREFEAGRIPEDDYRRRREALKRTALDAMRQADD